MGARSGTEVRVHTESLRLHTSFLQRLARVLPLALHVLSVRSFSAKSLSPGLLNIPPHRITLLVQLSSSHGALGKCMHQGHLWLEKAVVPLHFITLFLASRLLVHAPFTLAKVPVSWHLACM